MDEILTIKTHQRLQNYSSKPSELNGNLSQKNKIKKRKRSIKIMNFKLIIWIQSMMISSKEVSLKNHC